MICNPALPQCRGPLRQEILPVFVDPYGHSVLIERLDVILIVIVVAVWRCVHAMVILSTICRLQQVSAYRTR